MLDALRSRGFRRAPSQTPLEFARSVAEQVSPLGGVLEVTELFYRVRYREDQPTREELARAASVVRGLKARGADRETRRRGDGEI